MKKRVKSLLLGVAAIVGFGAFATACIESTSEHTHTYAEAWEKDAEGHWNALTCECTDVVPEKKAHVDKNNDAVCDICEYTDHEHTYAEDWTVDCTNHWHAADCGHIVAGADLAAHVDENEDGECDVCGYVIEDIHEHYYASEWTTDEEYHWHAAVCEHKDQVADKEAHVLNAAGDCTVCGLHVKDVAMADVGAVLAAAQANDYKIAFGDVIASEAVYGGTGAETLETGKTNKVHFALGEGQSYIQFISFDKDGNYLGQDEQWFEELDNGEIFGVQMENGEYELEPIAGGAQFLNGYNYIPGSIIPSDSADTSTLANMLVALYNQMKDDIRVSDAVEGYDEESGYYAFAYTYYSVNAQTTGGAVYNVEIELYNVAVTFSVNEEMIIDEANFYVEVYRDYSNIQNGVEVGDPDLDYTWNDLGGGNVEIIDLKLKDTANPTFYTYSVAQAAGERTFTTPYPRAALIPTSFEFLYVTKTGWNEDYTQQVVTESETIGDVLEVEEGVYAKFAIGDILPKTASTKFLKSEDFTYTFVNNDPNSTAIAWNVNDTTLNGYNAFSQMLKLKILEAGEYTVSIGFGGLTKTFILKVVGEPEPEIPEDDANHINVATTDTYGWADEYSYTAAEEGTYTFTVPAGLGVWEKEAYDNFSGDPKVDYNTAPNGGTFSVELEAGEVFEFYVGATTKGTWVITVSFVAGEVGGEDVGGGDEGGEDVGGGEESGAVVLANIVGTYTCDAGELVINADGTMTLDNGSLVQNYTIAIDGDTITYTLNGNSPYVPGGNGPMDGMAAYFGYLTFDANGMPATFVYNGEHVLTVGGGEEGGEDEVVYGTSENPYALVLGDNALEISQTVVDSYYVYCTLEVAESGWYSFVGYWNCSGDNKVIENADGVWIYAEAGTTLSVYKYVEVKGTLSAPVAKESVIETSASGVAIEGEGVYAVSVNYDVSAEGMLVNFTVTETGYYLITNSNFNNTVTYEGVAYNSMDGGLTLYAEVGSTYSLILDNIDFDADWNPIEASGVSFLTVEKVPTLTAGENTVVGNGEENKNVVIVVETTGTYTVSVEDKAAESIYFYGDVSVDGYNPWGTSVYSVVVELEAGVVYNTTVYFPSDENYEPLSGSWTITITEGGEEEVVAVDLAIGNNAINAANVTWAYTAAEDGTLNLAAGAAIGGMVSISYTVNGGESTVLELSTNVDLVLVAGDVVVITVEAEGYATLTANWTASAAGGEEATGEELVIGNNQIEAADVTYVYTATAEGTLNLAAGAAIMGTVEITYAVNGGEAATLALSSNVDLALVAGDEVVITVVAAGYSSITATWTPAPNGTEDAPYVIDALPADLTVEYQGNGAAGMVWYSFSVTEAGTFTITFDGTDNWFYVNQGTTQVFSGGSAAQLSYSTSLTVGDYMLGIATWSENAATLQVNVALEVAASGGGSEEGGAVVYLGANGSGRAMQVTVDAAAGTVSVIRAALAGNSLDTSSGATEYVGSYSYDGSTVTCTISGCTITWNADGSPASVVWGSATYTGFTAQ